MSDFIIAGGTGAVVLLMCWFIGHGYVNIQRAFRVVADAG